MKKMLLSATALFAVASLNAQIVNGDLENWTNTAGVNEPDNWLYDYGGMTGIQPGTLNFAAGFGEPQTTTEITGAAAAGGSGSSAELETKAPVPGGAWETNVGTPQIEGMLLGEWSFTGATPTTLEFDVDARPQAGDSCIVQVVLYDAGGNTLYFAGALFNSTNATTQWEHAIIPFQTQSAGTVAKVEVWAQSSYSQNDSYVIGSILRVDNFMLTSSAGVTELSFEANAYPNPASDVLNISLDRNASSVNIIAMDGKVVSSSAVTGSSVSVSVAGMLPGVYFYEVTAEDGSVVRNSFVKK